MRERVVVSGSGCISSLGVGTSTFIEGLLAGRTGIAPVDGYAVAGCRSRRAAPLRDFDPSRFFEPLKLRRVDEVGRIAVAACRLAIEEAGLPTKTDRVGVSVGSATSGLHSTIEHMHALATAGPSSVPALSFSNTVGNAAASLCAIEFGLRGPNVTFAQKQASSLAAIHYAVDALRRGRADGFVAGGFDGLHEKYFQVHDRLRVLSPRDGGEEGSRPFDRRRNGFVLGSGGHLLALEAATTARARGASVSAEILGAATTSAICPINDWPTDPEALVRAMTQALDDAGIPPAGVHAVFASANSTTVLDRMEAQALEQVFGPFGVPVVSIKGAIGEFGASGAAALTAAIGCLQRGMLPPVVGWQEADEACRVDVCPTARPAGGTVALVNSCAVGGPHFSLVIRVFAPGEFERQA